MSDPATIGMINDSQAQFLMVAIGARKGQAWLLRNLDRFSAPVVAYFGAVINFVAGTVRRAPRWVQRARLEWFWRILQEPALWRRYAGDGAVLTRLFFMQAIPAALELRLRAPSARSLAAARLITEDGPTGRVLRLEGAWTRHNLDPLRQALASVGSEGAPAPNIDLSRSTYIDTAVIGLLLLARGAYRSWVIEASPFARRMLARTCADYLLTLPAAAPRELQQAASIQ